MFKGRSTHNLDVKGRLAIPKRFKIILDEKGDDCLVVTNHEACLWAYTRDDWKDIEEKAMNLPQFKKEVVTYFRYFISGAVECPLKQGRITLPPELRKIAGLKKEVFLVGQLKKFEIWDKEKWEDIFLKAQNDFPDASQALSELGI